MFNYAEWTAGLKVGDIVSRVTNYTDTDATITKITDKLIYVRHSQYRKSDESGWERLAPSDEASKAERKRIKELLARIEVLCRKISVDTPLAVIEEIERLLA